MIKALALKELRESAGILVLAVLVMGYALAELTAFSLLPWQSGRLYHYPFVNDSLFFYFSLVVGGLAIVLGLRQSVWESRFGTYYFLLHRPISRGSIFGSKIAVGLLAVMSLGAVLILLYARWAATPGNMPALFEWSMTYPAWKFWGVMPMVYLGAFLSGMRPGNWFGTRLVPLVATLAGAMMIYALPWVWLTGVVSLAISFLLLLVIWHFVYQRDF